MFFRFFHAERRDFSRLCVRYVFRSKNIGEVCANTLRYPCTLTTRKSRKLGAVKSAEFRESREPKPTTATKAPSLVMALGGGGETLYSASGGRRGGGRFCGRFYVNFSLSFGCQTSPICRQFHRRRLRRRRRALFFRCANSAVLMTERIRSARRDHLFRRALPPTPPREHQLSLDTTEKSVRNQQSEIDATVLELDKLRKAEGMQTRRPEPEEETGEEEERAGYRFGEPDETGERR